MLLRVDVQDRDHHAVVAAVGEIDASTASLVSDAAQTALDEGRRVLLDLAQVTFIDSTGLGMLVKVHRAALCAGSNLALVRATPQTRKLVRVLGLDTLLHLYDSSEQALAAP